MTAFDEVEAIREWVNFIRNQDIFTITQRGVTTDSDTGTFSSDSTYLIDLTNVRNVRSVVVASVTLTYGTDYKINVDYDDSGTIKCLITFVAAQTGAYTITYDYGTEKIYPDFPKTDLTIGSFPRIGTDFLETRTRPAGFGGVNDNTNELTTIIYEQNTDTLRGYMKALRTAVFNNKSNFFYVGKLVQIVNTGPMIPSPRETGRDKIFQKNLDVEGLFVYEK